ncbi:MAG: DUF4302 domain-containing protein [Prevotellaceae bacterium]|jgi:hypothetical protein|nr:DUF4302 domain-containing protein [Prevotellaceae bacterium]
MKLIKNIIYLSVASLFLLQSCVKDEENIFDDSAAIRGQKAVSEYMQLLVSAENGWYVDYYPELNHKVGGYAMYLKFSANGMVDVSCEIATNLPPYQMETSQFEVFMEQGPILSFSTYNKVMHYFSEPYSTDVNGREGDYEFIIMNAKTDEILIKGKKGGNKMTLRRNTDNLNPDTHLAEIANLADLMSGYSMFELIVENLSVGIAAVTDRTFDMEYSGDIANEKISYAFTIDGIRLYEPYTINGVTMANFVWDNTTERYVCSDPGVNAYLKMYFPADFQIKYEDFLGKWKLDYQARTSAGWSTTTMDTVEIIEVKRNASFMLTSDKLFNFAGITLTFDPRKGIVSIYCINTDVHSSGHFVRQCPYDTQAGYIYTSVYNPPSYLGGLVGVWNNDENSERKITFEDNKVWSTYKANGILFRLYDLSNVSQGNYTGNTDGKYAFRNLLLTKID